MSKIILTLKVKEKSAKNIYDAIVQDIFDKGRSTLKIKLESGVLKFVVESDDYTSVRAAINAILLKLRMLEDLHTKQI